MECPLKPTAGRIVVRTITAPRISRGGILLPDHAKTRARRKVHEGYVAALGPGVRYENGEYAGVPMDSDGEPLAVGDRVVFTTEAGHHERREDGQTWTVLNEGDVLAVLK